MGRRTSSSSAETKRQPAPPARTAEEQENRMISLAYNLAEKQLEEGTASAQVITTFLKAGSRREQLEQRNKELENELLIAKTSALKSAERVEELYANAIAAMQSYAGDD